MSAAERNGHHNVVGFFGTANSKNGPSGLSGCPEYNRAEYFQRENGGLHKTAGELGGLTATGNGYLISQVTPSSNIGQGVSITAIKQLRSEYLDMQYRDQNADFCRSEYMTQGLTYMKDLFNELDDDTSLTISIANFFDAMSDFADKPTSEAARTTVQQAALSMSGSFNLIHNEMVDLYNSQNTSAMTVASQINEIAAEIAGLNEAIAGYEISGQSANDLRDQRNLLLDELSGYTKIAFSEDDTGMVSVAVAGQTLVDGKTASTISITKATDEINTICQQLADLNDDILAGGGATAAQADERDALIAALDSISGKLTCTVNGDDTATVTIDYVDSTTMTAATDTLVSGSTFTAATGDAVAEYPGADDEYVLRLGDTYLNTDSLESGELHAHLTLRDGGSVSEAGIPYYISQLDELARSVVQAVNECMNTGYTFPDEENGFASVTGVDMFEDFGNAYALVTAGNFTLSAAVTQSVWNIAASDKPIDLTAADTQSANNVVALKLAELIDTNDFSGTLDGMIAHLGVKLKNDGRHAGHAPFPGEKHGKPEAIHLRRIAGRGSRQSDHVSADICRLFENGHNDRRDFGQADKRYGNCRPVNKSGAHYDKEVTHANHKQHDVGQLSVQPEREFEPAFKAAGTGIHGKSHQRHFRRPRQDHAEPGRQ